jgi:hypothetical protein
LHDDEQQMTGQLGGSTTEEPGHPTSSADDDTLSTKCLLQYCAQWPQHRHWVKQVLLKDGFDLEYLVNTPFCADKELVLAAVSSCGAAFQFAAPALRGDRDVVLRAVQTDPFALAFTGALRADAGIVLAALQRDPAAVALADARLLCDAGFMLDAIKLDATAATYAAPALLADESFRAAAKAANPYCENWFVNTEHFPGLDNPVVQQEFQQQG